MRPIRSFALAVALIGASLAQAADARTTLVRSRPNPGEMIVKPGSLDLEFSGEVPAAALSLDLVMTAMPGMANHKPMPIRGYAVEVKGTDATLRFPRPLPSGAYRLDWKVTGDAAMEGRGSLTFKVG